MLLHVLWPELLVSCNSYVGVACSDILFYFSFSNKNWIYRSDNWLLATRFESILSMRTQFDLVEMVSWNDFGESHYMGSLAPAVDQPNSTGWTNGFPHTAWLSLLKYYATAWKTGAYPANTDVLWLWSRPHPKDATPSSPTNARPNNYAATDDQLYVVATLASDATVTISSGANTATWNLPAGLSKLAIASAAGSITAKIVRAGATVKSYDSAGSFSYNLSPADYNFNYFVASA